VNLLLLRPDEACEDEVWLGDRRAQHLLGLLGKRAGDQVRVGIVGQGSCEATVLEVDLTVGRVRLLLGMRTPEAEPTTSVILALPRPKALSRIVQLAASFGVRRLDLVAAYKVDPAYFSSPRLHPARLSEDALLGLEQGGLVHEPAFAVHRSLRGFLEDRLWPQQKGEARVIFHPGASHHLVELLLGGGHDSASGLDPTTLAFGPDGGFLPRELEAFVAAGFRSSTLSRSTLRTEVAVAAGLAQLELIRAAGLPVAVTS
jgi:16S rRNA (uracil1498-N3)-methyltransferase